MFLFRNAFSLAGNLNSLAIDWECRQIHLPHATFSHVQSLHRSHSTDDMCARIKMSCGPKIGHSSTRHVSPCASQYTEHLHKSSLTNLSCVTVVLLSTYPLIHCGDPRQDGTSTELPLFHTLEAMLDLLPHHTATGL